MNKLSVITVFLLGLLSVPASAKPLLTDSQDTFVSVCIDLDDTLERLIEICERALDETGASQRQIIDVLDSLAYAQFQLDQMEQAKATYQRMLEIDPNATDGLTGLGWIAYDEDDYEAAAKFFERASGRAPTAQILGGLGASLARSDQIEVDAALEYLDAALSVDPDYHWAIREKGWLLARASRWDEAKVAFQSALEERSDDINALYGMAYLFSKQDDWETALDYANRVLAENPDHVSALLRRSRILFELERPKQSIKDADRVIELRPEWSDGYVRKARALSRIGRRQDAIELLAEAEKQIGFDGFLVYWRAKFLFWDEEYPQALKQIQRSIDHGEADSHDQRLRARIALEMGKVELARESVNVALDFEADNEWTLYYDALTLVAEEQFEQAEKRFVLALENGLPKDRLQNFLSALNGKEQFSQSIRLRIYYSLRD